MKKDIILRRQDLSQGIYLILQGVVSIKHKGKEIARRGPNEYVGDESLFRVASPYDYECSSTVFCLLMTYESIIEVINERSPVFASLLKVVGRNREALVKATKDTFQYEANILSQGRMIGKYLKKMKVSASRAQKKPQGKKIISKGAIKSSLQGQHDPIFTQQSDFLRLEQVSRSTLSPTVSGDKSVSLQAIELKKTVEKLSINSVVHPSTKWTVRFPSNIKKKPEGSPVSPTSFFSVLEVSDEDQGEASELDDWNVGLPHAGNRRYRTTRLCC